MVFSFWNAVGRLELAASTGAKRVESRGPAGLLRMALPFVSVSINPHPCHSEERSDVGIRIFSDRNLRKAQNLCVLETDCRASVYPKGTCFAARTGSQ